MTAKIPVTVITGFLGAGKTTLIRQLIQNAAGRRLAFIINEFGDIGIDGEILKGCGDENCSEEDIVELANGCICCTVAEDFIPAMEKILNREERPDHIIIETSGLALPQPLVRAFNWPEIKTEVTVDGVVTLVDAPAVAAGRFAANEQLVQQKRKEDDALDHESPLEELFEDQVNCADLIILSKADLIDERSLAEVNVIVGEEAREHTRIIEATNGKLPIEVVLGLSSQAEDDNRLSHHERHHLREGEEIGVDHEHDHDEFESFIINFGTIDDIDSFKENISAAIKAHDILRVKGFVSVQGKDMRLVLQAVGARIDTYYDRPWTLEETRSSSLVIIGQAGLNKHEIELKLNNHRAAA